MMAGNANKSNQTGLSSQSNNERETSTTTKSQLTNNPKPTKNPTDDEESPPTPDNFEKESTSSPGQSLKVGLVSCVRTGNNLADCWAHTNCSITINKENRIDLWLLMEERGEVKLETFFNPLMHKFHYVYYVSSNVLILRIDNDSYVLTFKKPKHAIKWRSYLKVVENDSKSLEAEMLSLLGDNLNNIETA